MATYPYDTNDKLRIAAITAARENFNASLPALNDVNGDPVAIEDKPGYFADDLAYFQARCEDMVSSWQKNFGLDESVVIVKEAELLEMKECIADAKK